MRIYNIIYIKLFFKIWFSRSLGNTKNTTMMMMMMVMTSFEE